MTNQQEPYNRVHIGPDRTTLVEHATVDLADHDPVVLALEGVGVVAVTLRYSNNETLTYSKRVTA